MTIRTSQRTVTFERPFTLASFDKELPAGSYDVETDEELLEGISFPVYRRIVALIHLHAHAGSPGQTQKLPIDPNELDAALARDRASDRTLSGATTDLQAINPCEK
jgi:hypothetical protein